MNIINIICGSFILLGIILFIIGVVIKYNNICFKKRCTIKTEARVSGNGHKTMGKKDKVPNDKLWYPFFEFYVQDKLVNMRYYYGTEKIKYNIDEVFEILYNPDTPEEFFIPKDKSPAIKGMVLTSAGIASFIAGIVAFIIAVKFFV